MIYVLYYPHDGGTSTRYDKIWDVRIDPQAIEGSNYFACEGQKARFSIEYTSDLDNTFFYKSPTSVFPESVLYTGRIELWEQLDYYAGGAHITSNKMLMWGNILQPGVTFETIGLVDGEKKEIAHITVYDYIGVMIYTIQNPKVVIGRELWVDNNPLPGEPYYAWRQLTPTRKIRKGEVINIDAELRLIWNSMPQQLERPPLSDNFTPYPDYLPFALDHLIIHTQAETYGSDNSLVYYNGQVYGDSDGNPIFESFTFGGEWTNSAQTRWKYKAEFIRYEINSTYLSEIFRQCDEDTVGVEDIDNDYAWSWAFWANEYGLNMQTWQDNNSYMTANNILYELNEHDTSAPRFVTVTGSMAWQYLEELTGGEINPYDIKGEINLADWFAYLLAIKFAWLKRDGISYVISNKSFFPDHSISGFGTSVQIMEYSETYEQPQLTNVVYEVFRHGKEISESTNQYASTVLLNYPKIVTFAANEDVEVGDYVQIPDYHSGSIFIIEKDYDPANPHIWRYKGRAQ